MKKPVPEATKPAAGGASAGGMSPHLSSHGCAKVLQHRGLGCTVDREVLHRWDEALCNELAIGWGCLPPHKLGLQACHLGLEGPILLCAQGVELEGTAQGDDQQQATHQAADECSGDDLAGHSSQAAVLIAAILAVLLAITAPRLKDAQVGATVEGARLAGEAVLFIGTIRTAFLVVAAVSRCIAQTTAPLAGVLVRWAGRTALLIPATGTVPPTIAALWL